MPEVSGNTINGLGETEIRRPTHVYWHEPETLHQVTDCFAADLAVQKPYWNPRPVEREAIRDLLQMAWSGNPPE